MTRIYSSKNMNKEDCQDYESPMVLVGSDVVSIYPNLDVARAARLMYEAVKISPMKWENIRLVGMQQICCFKLEPGTM